MPEASAQPGKSLFVARALLPEGWARNVRIILAGGRIAAIETMAEAAAADEKHACVLPGMANVHSHAFQRAMAGLTERGGGPAGDTFWTWREIMYQFVARMTPDHIRAVAALAYVEMLESGFTRVGEFHYLHHDQAGRHFDDMAEMSGAIAAAASEAGIGLTLLPVLYSHSGFGGLPPGEGQRRFILSVEDYARLLEGAARHVADLPDAVVGVAPHSLRAVSPDQLRELAPLIVERPVHIHIAEQVREVEQCLTWSGQRPVEWLLNHAEVDRHWCLVHATHMNPAETAALAHSGAIAGLCPITEANLGDGLFPAEAFLAAGGRFGVGSDSNVLIDCAEELRLLEYGQRLARQARSIMAHSGARSTGAGLYEAASKGGAAALGTTGGLEAGASADMVSLDLGHPALMHREDDALLDSFIFAAGRSAIDCVWRRGEKLVAGGAHRARARIVENYRGALKGLLA